MNEGCSKCTGQTENIISISTPLFWLKVKIEMGQLIVAFDCKPFHGMRTSVPLRYCPFCGREFEG